MIIKGCGVYFKNSLMLGIAKHFEDANIPLYLWSLDEEIEGLEHLTKGKGKTSKFEAYNDMLQYCLDADLVIYADDDVILPKGFFPGYLNVISHLNYDMAQPAQTPESNISHDITRQQANTIARTTTFVECGPVFSVKKDFLAKLVPFSKGMGHGLDYWWSALANKEGYKLGIVDLLPIIHNSREVGSTYSKESALESLAYNTARIETGTYPGQRVIRRYPL